jgi:hypothetical protein
MANTLNNLPAMAVKSCDKLCGIHVNDWSVTTDSKMFDCQSLVCLLYFIAIHWIWKRPAKKEIRRKRKKDKRVWKGFVIFVPNPRDYCAIAFYSVAIFFVSLNPSPMMNSLNFTFRGGRELFMWCEKYVGPYSNNMFATKEFPAVLFFVILSITVEKSND